MICAAKDDNVANIIGGSSLVAAGIGDRSEYIQRFRTWSPREQADARGVNLELAHRKSRVERHFEEQQQRAKTEAVTSIAPALQPEPAEATQQLSDQARPADRYSDCFGTPSRQGWNLTEMQRASAQAELQAVGLSRSGETDSHHHGPGKTEQLDQQKHLGANVASHRDPNDLEREQLTVKFPNRRSAKMNSEQLVRKLQQWRHAVREDWQEMQRTQRPSSAYESRSADYGSGETTSWGSSLGPHGGVVGAPTAPSRLTSLGKHPCCPAVADDASFDGSCCSHSKPASSVAACSRGLSDVATPSACSTCPRWDEERMSGSASTWSEGSSVGRASSGAKLPAHWANARGEGKPTASQASFASFCSTTCSTTASSHVGSAKPRRNAAVYKRPASSASASSQASSAKAPTGLRQRASSATSSTVRGAAYMPRPSSAVPSAKTPSSLSSAKLRSSSAARPSSAQRGSTPSSLKVVSTPTSLKVVEATEPCEIA